MIVSYFSIKKIERKYELQGQTPKRVERVAEIHNSIDIC